MDTKDLGGQDYTNIIESIEEDVQTLIRVTITQLVTSVQNETKTLTTLIDKVLQEESAPALLESINQFYQTNISNPRILIQEISSFINTRIGYDVNCMKRELRKVIAFNSRAQLGPPFLQNFNYWDQINENILFNAKEEIFTLIESKIVTKYKSILNKLTETQMVITNSPMKVTADSLTHSLQQWEKEITDLLEILLKGLKKIDSNVQTMLEKEGKELKKGTALIIRTFHNGEGLDEFKYPPKGDGTPFPYIYYFPYPKGPPIASARAIPKKIEEICPKCGEINARKRMVCEKCGANLIPFS